MDAFDADVLIYAAAREHPLGRRVAALFPTEPQPEPAGVGSVLLLPEVLGKPLRDGITAETAALATLLNQLRLLAVDRATAEHATALAAKYALRAADSTHLATAVLAGADRFVTNNRRDFPASIAEIDIVYPADLPEPA